MTMIYITLTKYFIEYLDIILYKDNTKIIQMLRKLKSHLFYIGDE